MKTQDLKDNRNEIIERINEIADISKTKEIMTAMVRIIEGEMNETEDCVDLVDEVVSLMGYEKKYDIQIKEDIKTKAALNQRGSSMR